MPFGPASQLGVALYEETPPVELWPGASDGEADIVIRAVYRQVLGNAYVMESERLVVPESQLKRGEISVREFVRRVGKSDLYRSRFFDSCARYRYTELACKHFLGRAPNGFDEMRAHSNILDTEGYEADIDSYLDSDEYQTNFGEDTVPFVRGYKTEACQTMVGFTHFFKLQRGASSSDLKGSVSGNRPRLNRLVIQAIPTAVVAPSGGSSGWSFAEPPVDPRAKQGSVSGQDGKVYRIEVTAYRAKGVNRVSKFRRSNQVYLVPYNRLSEEYQRIHRQGGVIASITPV